MDFKNDNDIFKKSEDILKERRTELDNIESSINDLKNPIYNSLGLNGDLLENEKWTERERERAMIAKMRHDDDRDVGNQARTFYLRFKWGVDEMKRDLKEKEELLITFQTSAGQVLSVENFGYHNPTTILLDCVDGNSNICTIFAHVQSVQLLARIIKIDETPQKQQVKIGFLGDVSKGKNSGIQDDSATDKD